MLQKCSIFRVAGVFFDEPEKTFSLAEIRRKSGMAHTSVLIHLKTLEKGGIITKHSKKAGKRYFPFYKARTESKKYKHYKIISTLEKIEKSGLADYLKNNCHPDCLVLFGSTSRGEDVKESDVDIYVKAPQKGLHLSKYEKMIGKKIQLHFKENFGEYPKELKNNIINGIILSGYLEAFK